MHACMWISGTFFSPAIPRLSSHFLNHSSDLLPIIAFSCYRCYPAAPRRVPSPFCPRYRESGKNCRFFSSSFGVCFRPNRMIFFRCRVPHHFMWAAGSRPTRREYVDCRLQIRHIVSADWITADELGRIFSLPIHFLYTHKTMHFNFTFILILIWSVVSAIIASAALVCVCVCVFEHFYRFCLSGKAIGSHLVRHSADTFENHLVFDGPCAQPRSPATHTNRLRTVKLPIETNRTIWMRVFLCVCVWPSQLYWEFSRIRSLQSAGSWPKRFEFHRQYTYTIWK